MNNHGLVGELDEGLGEGQCLVGRLHVSSGAPRFANSPKPGAGKGVGAAPYERAEAGAKATDENEAYDMIGEHELCDVYGRLQEQTFHDGGWREN